MSMLVSAISLLLVADQSTLNHIMISKMPPKGSPVKKKRAKKGTTMKKAKKTLVTMPTSDSDPGALGGRLAGSYAEDGNVGEGLQGQP